MEWKKSNISGSELEKQQQAYIKEALEMAKRSITAQSERNAAEKAAAERAAAERAAAERAAAEKAAAEKAPQKAAAEKAAAEKAAAEKAAAEKAAAEKAAAEKAAAEKAAAEKAAAEKAAAEKAAAEKAAAEKAAAEKAANENAIEEKCEKESESEELTQFTPLEESDKCDLSEKTPEKITQSGEAEIIDIAQFKKGNFTEETSPSPNTNNPPNFNSYINQHNRAQCNCPACQRKRSAQ